MKNWTDFAKVSNSEFLDCLLDHAKTGQKRRRKIETKSLLEKLHRRFGRIALRSQRNPDFIYFFFFLDFLDL